MNNQAAFPSPGVILPTGAHQGAYPGMTLRQYYAAAALQNHLLCTGIVSEYQLRIWFGNKGGVTRAEIIARQALEHADALLAATAQGDRR